MAKEKDVIQLPFKITEIGEEMLVALDRNFKEIERHLSTLQLIIKQITGGGLKDLIDAADIWERASALNEDGTFSATSLIGQLVADQIADSAISASKINANLFIISGDVWTDNSPTEGEISWNEHNIFWNGVKYTIAAGHTAKKHVYWDSMATVYGSSTSMPDLSDTGFIIAINNSGKHQLVWKQGIAKKLIGEEMLDDGAVTTTKIANAAIGSAAIAEAAILSTHIHSAAIETAHIKDAAITSAKIKDITADKITIGSLTTFEEGYNPVDNHLFFQYSVDGTTWHSVFNAVTDKYARQKIGDNGTWSDPMRIVGEDGYTPVKGTDYFDGVDGQAGTSSYLWVRYSQNANGNPMTTDPTGAKYVGIATTTTAAAPSGYASYLWSLVKGTDGIPGEDGDDGQTSYLHIKYSDDGETFTANNGETVGAWIGTYVDFTQADSTTFSKYTWNKVKGEDGYTPVKGTDYFDGVDGQAGTSSYLWVRYSQNANGNPMTTDPTGAKYVGIATTTTAAAPSGYASYLWSLVKGTDGIPGEDGDDGQTSYLHIKYSDDGETFTANNGETVGAWIGTYVDFTQADSTTFSKYTWNKVKGEDGQDVRKFTSQPVPPYNVGDLWIVSGVDTRICIAARDDSESFASTDWQDIAIGKFDLPGYVQSTAEGIKVFDASEDLRVLLGSWLVDAVRKYGLKVIGGEILSSLIQTSSPELGSSGYFARVGGYSRDDIVGFYQDTEGIQRKNYSLATGGNGGTLTLYQHGRPIGDIIGYLYNNNVYMTVRANRYDDNGQLDEYHCYGVSMDGGLDGGCIKVAAHSKYVYITGDMTVTGSIYKTGSLSYIEPTEDYGIRILNAVESPELLYQDSGVDSLKNGETIIYLDPIFLQCIEPDTEFTPWKIWVECYGENGVYVNEVGRDYFKIKERNNGDSNNKVVWKIEATRKSYAGIRLMETSGGDF